MALNIGLWSDCDTEMTISTSKSLPQTSRTRWRVVVPISSLLPAEK
jgi:hypothetical protein